MGTKTPIADFVRGYAGAGTSRLHMPGHKGRSFLGCEALDITEIKGADELYAAGGIIAESERNAARLFGTARTFYSTEGSSQCIRAMLCLAVQAAPKRGGRPVLLAARNAHKALLYAAALLDFDIEWLWPQASEPTLCGCPLTAAGLRAELDRLAAEGTAPFGVYITSPDYLGGMQDVHSLAEVCRAHNVPLLVDNAHGAYLRFLPYFNYHPIALGAAMCCDSAHKTLPVLTGGAYLHLGENAPVKDEAAVRGALALFGSTSPSYLILQSLDLANTYIEKAYTEKLRVCTDKLARLRMELNGAAIAAGSQVPFARSSVMQEPLKLTLDAAAIGTTGQALAETLRAYKTECEYADPRYLVLMPTPENTGRDLERVRRALLAAIKAAPQCILPPQSDAAAFDELRRQAKRRCTIREAVLGAQECVPVHRALGRVCAMPTVSCPPAIPVAVSGEEIGRAAVELMLKYGINDIAVLKQP